MFSKACEYGIKAMLYITTQSLEGKRVKVGEIAENAGCPEAFTAKVLGALTKSNLVQSKTGPLGGFYIEKERMNQICLSQIVFAIDGDSIYKGCGLGLEICDEENPCPIHHQFSQIRNDMKTMLNSTMIHDLALGIKAGKSVLFRN